MFDVFVHARDMDSFFAVPMPSVSEFDILDMPPGLWRHIYLIEVGQDGALCVRQYGSAIHDAFKRPLKGMDLRDFVHGAHSRDVLALYDDVQRTGQAFAVQQTVYLVEQTCIVRVECAMRPLWDGGRVARILGCLFVDREIDVNLLSGTSPPTKIHIELPDFPEG